MINADIFDSIYNYLEDCPEDNLSCHLADNRRYQNALSAERTLAEQYQSLVLTEEQRSVIDKWVDSMQATNAAHSMVLFRLGMQSCFSLLMQLSGQK